jgi:hypothetical protein
MNEESRYGYISITGQGFDPHQFNDSLPKQLAGAVRPIYRMINDTKTVIALRWDSPQVGSADGQLEDELLGLISRYEFALRQLQPISSIKISAYIVHPIGTGSPPRGFYLSHALIGKLRDNNMDLDIDVVRKLK